jgi:hypothetical protein
MSQQTVDLFKFVALRSPDEPQASALSLGISATIVWIWWTDIRCRM